MKKIIFVLFILLGFCHYTYAQPTTYIISGRTVINGTTTISTANTAVQLSTDTPVNEVHLLWHHKNAGPIFVGSSSVTTNNGAVLYSGAVLTLNVDNLNDVYVISETAGDKVTWIAVQR